MNNPNITSIRVRKEFETYIDNLDVRPLTGFVIDCLIVFFVVTNTSKVVFDGLVWVPAFILESNIYQIVMKAKIKQDIHREMRS